MSDNELQERINKALDAAQDGGVDGAHHKMWVIDQMVRCLTGCPIVESVAISATSGKPYKFFSLGESPEYKEWVAAYCRGEDGEHTYAWDTGIAL